MNAPSPPEQVDPELGYWQQHRLGELPGVAMVTYGVVNAGQHVPDGVPLLQAGDIVNGTIAQADPMRIADHVHAENSRTRLDAGDLVIVLVGRIGDAASVGKEQAGWNAARSVGVVKFTVGGHSHRVDAWLRGWLKTPMAREWCVRNATGGLAHATLSVSALKQLPIPLPPLGRRQRLLKMIDSMDRRRCLNTEIAVYAVELADAYFARSILRHGGTCARPLSEVAAVINGIPRIKSAEPGASIAWVAPAEVLQSPGPYLDHTAQTAPLADTAVCDPGVVLLASRPREVKAVISRIPAVPGRGAVALRTTSGADSLWLLHEMRSRSRDLSEAVQGTQGREMSVRALSRLKVSWPDTDVRRAFAEIAVSLHDRAYTALKENRVLDEVIAAEMSAGIPDICHAGPTRARG